MHNSRTEWGIGYPLAAAGEAAQTVVGWSVTVAAVTVLGHWLGLWIGQGSAPGAADTLCRVAISLLLFFYPPFTFAIVVTLLAWFVPIDVENFPLRVGAAIVCLLTWIVVIAGYTFF